MAPPGGEPDEGDLPSLLLPGAGKPAKVNSSLFDESDSLESRGLFVITEGRIPEVEEDDNTFPGGDLNNSGASPERWSAHDRKDDARWAQQRGEERDRKDDARWAQPRGEERKKGAM